MQHSAVARSRACWWLVLPVVASCAFACSLEDRPSLGRYESAPVPQANPGSGGGANASMGGASTGNGAGTGGLGAAVIGMPVDSGQRHPTMHMPLDAGGDAQTDAASIFDAAMNDAPGCIGVYAGDFTCMVDPVVVAPPMAMVQMTLVMQPSQTEHVAKATAPLSFSFAGFAFAGDVAGSLDCRTNELHATVQNGLFASEVAPIPFAFQGQIDGELDQATRSLTGTWQFSSVDFGGSCTGTWGAKLQPQP